MLTEEALTEELEALLDTAREQDSLKRILELSNLQGNCTMLVSCTELVAALREKLTANNDLTALSIISNLAVNKDNKVILMKSQIVEALVAIAKANIGQNTSYSTNNSGEKREIALGALWTICDCRTNVMNLVSPGCPLIPTLIEAVAKEDAHTGLSALGALWSISDNRDNRALLAQPFYGLLGVLRNVLADDNAKCKIMALSILANIADVFDNKKVIFAPSLGIVQLLQSITANQDEDPQSRLSALTILLSLAHHPANKGDFIRPPISIFTTLDRIVAEDRGKSRLTALLIMQTLTEDEDNKRVIPKHIAPALVKTLLEIVISDKAQARVSAIAIICNLLELPENKASFIAEYAGILETLRDVAATDKAEARVQALAALWSLSEYPANTSALAHHDFKLVPILEEIVSSDRKGARLKALGLLHNLTNATEDVIEMKSSTNGIVKVLRETILADGGEARVVALQAMRHLAETEDLRAYMVSRQVGILTILHDLLVKGASEDGLVALELLSSVSKCKESWVPIASASLGLLTILKQSIEHTRKGRLHALMTLSNIAEAAENKAKLLAPSFGLLSVLHKVIVENVELESTLALSIISNCASLPENKSAIATATPSFLELLHKVLLRYTVEARLKALTILQQLSEDSKVVVEMAAPALGLLDSLRKIILGTSGVLRHKALAVLTGLAQHPSNLELIMSPLVATLCEIVIDEDARVASLGLILELVNHPTEYPLKASTDLITVLCDLMMENEDANGGPCLNIIAKLSVVPVNRTELAAADVFLLELLCDFVRKDPLKHFRTFEILNNLAEEPSTLARFTSPNLDLQSTLTQLTEDAPDATVKSSALKLLHRLFTSVGKYSVAWDVLHSASDKSTNPKQLSALVESLGLSCSEHLGTLTKSQKTQFAALLKPKAQKDFLDSLSSGVPGINGSVEAANKAAQEPAARTPVRRLSTKVPVSTPSAVVRGTLDTLPAKAKVNEFIPMRRQSAPNQRPGNTATTKPTPQTAVKPVAAPSHAPRSSVRASAYTRGRSASVHVESLPPTLETVSTTPAATVAAGGVSSTSTKRVPVGKLSEYISRPAPKEKVASSSATSRERITAPVSRAPPKYIKL